MALFFKVPVKEIYMYPLGAISRFDMELNTSILKEFIILIMGPIFQLIAYAILINILPKDKELINIYNIGILGFNLLPIYPLDGGKLLKLVLDKYITYKRSFKTIIIVSYISTFIVLITNKKITLNIIIIVVFLLININKENKKISYYYQKFILERYLNKYKFRKSKLINNLNNFYRNRRHIIKDNDKYYLEREYLEKIYKK